MDRLEQVPQNTRPDSTFAILAAVLLLGISSGCQATRTHFQMDSNSRIPFFGLDFVLPRKSNNIQEISHSADSEAESVVKAHLEETPKPASRWSRWMHPLKKPQQIVLPLTDVERDIPDTEVPSTEVFAVDEF